MDLSIKEGLPTVRGGDDKDGEVAPYLPCSVGFRSRERWVKSRVSKNGFFDLNLAPGNWPP